MSEAALAATVKTATVTVTVIAALTLAACGDDLALDVQVHHPEGAAIARTTVSIYESSTAACRQIELGDLSAAELQAILTAEVTFAPGERGALEGIAREDRKLVVARGLDAAGRLVAAGCAEKAAITGRDTVEIDTDFAATLSVGALAAVGAAIPLTLTDAQGRSLPGHEVTWRVYGPAGAPAAPTTAALAPVDDGGWELAAPTCTDPDGVARVHPVPPARVGGYAIALRPRWPAQPPPLLTSFTRVEPAPTNLTPKQDVTRPCALRVAGSTRRLACLQLTGPGGAAIVREYEATVVDGDARLVERATAPIASQAIALFSVERGPTVRDVYAVTTDAQVLGVFGPSVAPAPGANLPAAVVASDALLLPACDAGQASRLLLRVTAAERRVLAMPPLGGAVADYHGIQAELSLELGLRTTGCVTELRPGGEPRRRQASVIDQSQRLSPMSARATSSVFFECDLPDVTRCRANLPVPSAGAGLSPPPRAGANPGAPAEEPRLTGLFFDASGVVMSSWVLLPGMGSELLLVERERVPSAAIPESVVSGHFDADGLTDVLWDLPNTALVTSNLQVTYGRRIGTQRLSALSGSESIVATSVLAADLTGDGLDEIVLVGRRRESGATRDGILVIPMGAPIGNPTSTVDPPCP